MGRQTIFRSSFVRNKTVPLLVGFILGSVLSLFLFPLIEDDIEIECSNKSLGISSSYSDLSSSSLIKKRAAVSSTKIPRPNNPNGSKSSIVGDYAETTTPKSRLPPKTNRPRFCATELGIKDKLFVGVVTSKENLATIASAINKTVAHHVSKLAFFVDSSMGSVADQSSSPRYLNLINIAAGTPDNLKPFAIFNYMAGRGQALANNYDWFFFMPDSVYLKAFKLYELVSHISFGYDVQIGRPWRKRIFKSDDHDESTFPTKYCDFNAGILISFGLMRSIMANLRDCIKNVDPTLTASENLGRCILLANSDAVCSEEWNGKAYRSWPLSGTSRIADDLSDLARHDSFNSALTVNPISSVSDIYHLHKYYCNQEIDQINQLITTVEQSLLKKGAGTALSSSSSPSNDESPDELIWPPGASAPSRPRSRYELLKWDYFTSTSIYESSNDLNVRPLSGANEKDVKQVLSYSVTTFAEKYPWLKFRRLLSGYRRFDPKRGMDYLLDLTFSSTAADGGEIRKRLRLLRPLNRVELVPAPYVTESTPVVILVPVATPAESTAALAFLDRFARVCLEVNENARLIFGLFYQMESDQDAYRSSLTPSIDVIRKKYNGGGGDSKLQQPPKVDTIFIRASVPSPFSLLDAVMTKIGGESLYLVVTPWTEVYGDFLNRVRMNTIKEFQVFAPIPFVQFNPKIVHRQQNHHRQRSPNDHIEVHKNVGHFDRHDFSVFSFYGTDYYDARRRQQESFSPAKDDDGERLYLEHDLVDLFILNSNSNSTTLHVHVLRAVEPALKIRYHEKRCDAQRTNDLYSRCSRSKQEGLGTKAHLASLLLEYGAINDSL